jgi:hypothetical protein
MTSLIIDFRNFVKTPYRTTAHKTSRPPLAIAEGKFVTDKFLIRKLHDSEIEKLIILDPTFKIKFMLHFRKSFQTLTKKYFDEYIVICWWHVKMSLKVRNINTTVCYKDKIVNVVSKSGKNTSC